MNDKNLSEEINTNNYDDKVEQPPKRVSGGVCSVINLLKDTHDQFISLSRVSFMWVKFLIIMTYVKLNLNHLAFEQYLVEYHHLNYFSFL